MYVELRHIDKSFGGFKASGDVSFGVEKGGWWPLLGPSGGGKTTILRIIAGLKIRTPAKSSSTSASCSKTTPCSGT